MVVRGQTREHSSFGGLRGGGGVGDTEGKGLSRLNGG